MSGESKYSKDIDKLDSLAVLGLQGVVDSLAYKIDEIEKHNHSAQQVYGLTANTMARKSTTPIVIVGGNAAWGTELELHNGTVIEGGSATMKFDMNNLYVSLVSTANRITILEFYRNTLAADSAQVVTTDATDLFTLAGHGLVDGDKIMLKTIVTTTGINVYTVYYVVNMVGNDWKVSLTSGGAAVVLGGGNGTCYFNKITAATLITETIVSKSSNAGSDDMVIPMQMGRQVCNARISCRGWAAGGTNDVSFHLGLHTYIG
jgi:hypothetical protein